MNACDEADVVELVLFDLDGTLLDTLDDLWAAVNVALNECGEAEAGRFDVRRAIGRGVRRLIEALAPKEKCEDIYRAFGRAYEANMNRYTRPFEGAEKCIGELKARGVSLGVVSNKYDAAAKALVSEFFPDMFDAVAGHREGAGLKPAPDMYAAVLDDLGISDKTVHAVFIGDGESDALFAKACGAEFVGALWGYRTRKELSDAGAEIFATTPSEAAKIIVGKFNNFRT